jgi:hypothetical protein
MCLGHYRCLRGERADRPPVGNSPRKGRVHCRSPSRDRCSTAVAGENMPCHLLIPTRFALFGILLSGRLIACATSHSVVSCKFSTVCAWGQYTERATNWRAWPKLREREVALIDIGVDPRQQGPGRGRRLMRGLFGLCVGMTGDTGRLPEAAKCGRGRQGGKEE